MAAPTLGSLLLIGIIFLGEDSMILGFTTICENAAVNSPQLRRWRMVGSGHRCGTRRLLTPSGERMESTLKGKHHFVTTSTKSQSRGGTES